MDEKNILKIIKILKTKKCICLLAPSFPVDYKYPSIIYTLKSIGFDKVFELTYAAKIINMHYYEIIENNPEKQYICANCPCTVKYIETQFPEFKKNIIDVASPMVIMGRFAKEKFKEYKTIFIGPCEAKKQEAKKYKAVNYALTFQELNKVIEYFEKNNKLRKISKIKKNLQFDSLYNDYTKIYPLSGAVADTLHYKKIIKKNQIIIADGFTEIKDALLKMKQNKKIRFIDALFCKGGCISGPGINSKESIKNKTKLILKYKETAKHEKIGKHKGLFKYSKNLKIKRL